MLDKVIRFAFVGISDGRMDRTSPQPLLIPTFSHGFRTKLSTLALRVLETQGSLSARAGGLADTVHTVPSHTQCPLSYCFAA